MNKAFHNHATEANHRLITQVASYYNDDKENVEFYKDINSMPLQEMSKDHLLHWKSELRSLIFCGMNCTDKRSA